MKRRVIKRSELPVNLPVSSTVLAWMALDHWNAPEWLYGVFIALGAVLWIAAIWLVIVQEGESVIENTENRTHN